MLRIMKEISLERDAQDEKWGEQSHPDGTGEDNLELLVPYYETAFNGELAVVSATQLREEMRARTELAFSQDSGTYEMILTEEWAEVLAESDPYKLRKELIQLAAVAVAWIQKLDRDIEKLKLEEIKKYKAENIVDWDEDY